MRLAIECDDLDGLLRSVFAALRAVEVPNQCIATAPSKCSVSNCYLHAPRPHQGVF